MPSIFDYKYVGEYFGKVRLSIPLLDGGNEAIVIDPPCTPEMVKGVLLSRLADVGFSTEQIGRMLDGWDSPESKAQSRVVCSSRVSNTSGYLGVSPHVTNATISYQSTFMQSGKKHNKRFAKHLYPYLDHYSISDTEIEQLFIKACQASDAQRGYSIKTNAEYMSYYQPIDWQALLTEYNRKDGCSFKGLTITHRPASNFAYGDDCHHSRASLTRKYGVHFRRNEIPAEFLSTVEGINSWLGKKIGRKLGDLGPVYHHDGLVESGHPYVLPFINKKEIGFKVPERKYRQFTGDFVTFTSQLYPYGEQVSFSRCELNELFLKACDFAVKRLGMDAALSARYRYMIEIDWQRLIDSYMKSRVKSARCELVETDQPVSNLMYKGKAFSTLIAVSRELKLPRIKINTDWKTTDASEELARAIDKALTAKRRKIFQ